MSPINICDYNEASGRGVFFGYVDSQDYFHTFGNWGLILNSYSMTDPQPRETRIKIPGRSGTLDVSEYLTGDVVFDDRKFKASFTLPRLSSPYSESLDLGFIAKGYPSSWQRLHDYVAARIHGKRLKIIPPGESIRCEGLYWPQYYYIGRCAIGGLAHSGRIATMEITATCEPYKYRGAVTTFSLSLGEEESTRTLAVNNQRMRAVPSITNESDLQLLISKDGVTYSVEAGATDYVIPGFSIAPMGETMSFTGTGKVTLKYQEGMI